MKKWSGPIVVIAIVAIVLAIMIVPKYNGFVSSEETIESKYAQIENQLQRRLDLIPNLVNTVKGYAKHEKEVYEAVADARSKLAGASTPQEQAEANDELTGALNRLIAISEAYPELKADQQYTQLMDELAGTENRLAVAREDYNNAVQSFNSDIRKFPGNLVAGIFGFDKHEYFKVSEKAQEAPTVDFGDDE